MSDMQNMLALILLCGVFLIGILTIVKWILRFIDWVHRKIYVIIYGEPITPFNLFTIDEWKYEPWKDVKDRYPRNDK